MEQHFSRKKNSNNISIDSKRRNGAIIGNLERTSINSRFLISSEKGCRYLRKREQRSGVNWNGTSLMRKYEEGTNTSKRRTSQRQICIKHPATIHIIKTRCTRP